MKANEEQDETRRVQKSRGEADVRSDDAVTMATESSDTDSPEVASDRHEKGWRRVLKPGESTREMLQNLTDLDEDESVPLNFRNIIGGDILVSSLVRRQLFYLLFLCILSIIYVTNRYAYQQDIIERRRLTHCLEDRRLRAIVATSNLTEYTRRSNIEQHLTDTTIQSTSAPFYYLHTDMP